MQLILSDLSMSVGQSSLFGHSSNQEEGRAQSCTMAEKLSNKRKRAKEIALNARRAEPMVLKNEFDKNNTTN